MWSAEGMSGLCGEWMGKNSVFVRILNVECSMWGCVCHHQLKVQHREAGGGKSSVKHGSREETAEIFVCGRSDGWGTVREENRLVC